MKLETLNRTQKYLLESFWKDLNDEKFMDLKFIVCKFFNREKKQSDSEFDSSLKDSFIQLVSNIIYNYSFIINKYPTDPNLFLWQDKLEYYEKYELFIDMVLNEEKEYVQNELDLIVSELKKVLNLSYKLSKHI